MSGWGANIQNQIAQGFWSITEKQLHINCLELKAVYLAVQKFLPMLKNQKVLVRSDNTTVVQYINKQGGTHSPQLCYQTWDLWNYAIQHKIELKAAHIAGKLNVLPDHLSRLKIRPTEWTLKDSVVEQIFSIWGTPYIDLFASIHNCKTQMFCTWIPHPNAYATDALSVPWEGMFAYAFPPICLIPKVIQHMRQYHCRLILIAPLWPRRQWYTQLLQMSIAKPLKLQPIPKLLHQPMSAIYHPNPEVFHLTAWMLSTDYLERKAFLRNQEACSQLPGEAALKQITPVNLKNSVAGVVEGKLIHIQHL